MRTKEEHKSTPHSLHSPQVIDGTMVKLYAWYDNEFGYSMRMIELAEMVAASM